MDTTQKSVTQTGSPISKLDEDSSFFDRFSPLKTPKSIPTLNSLSFTSPPSPSSVYTSPYADSFKGFRRRYINHFSDPSEDGVASNEEVASFGEEKEKSLLETERPQILIDDCNTPEIINDVGEDVGMDLEKMCDKAKSEPPDWEPLIADAKAILIYGSPNESEAFSCLLNQTSNSEERLCVSSLPTSEPVLNTNVANNEYESFDALSRRQHCLDFEIPGSNQKQLGESSSSCLVPSIGLHQNAIATPSEVNNDCNEFSFYENLEVGLQSESGNETPMSSVLEELNPISPKKKRKRESSCKQCNCKRSKCLKLYCECFSAGAYCMDTCPCIDCFNKPINEDIVLATRQQIESRNPLAFAPKVIKSLNAIIKIGDVASKTPASARHKRGCNCKKSNCLKRYCECFQGGVGCSINCRCEGCKNSFGIKDGSASDANKENETSGKTGTMKTEQNVELFNLPAPPSTPMLLRQPLAQHNISSNNVLLPLQSHLHHGASGFSYNIRNTYMSMLPHSRMETITEDTDEENIIQSPMTNINALISPNSERGSLPHLGSSESTLWRRNGEGS